MKLLKEKYWNHFEKDGKEFERLIKTLLELEYEGKTFYLTKASHDGSRDIEAEIPILGTIKADIWAECKYRERRLPIDQVAMTLVMAYIEQARGILFFSYSPVNRSFTSYLSRFQDRSAIPIIVYDDMALEELILKHSNSPKIHSFFPAFFRESYQISTASSRQTVSVCCDVLKNGYKISCRCAEENLPYACLTDNITLWITLRNLSASDSVNVDLSIPAFSKQSDFLCLSPEKLQKTVSLAPGEVIGYQMDFRIRRFSGVLSLPKVQVCCNNEKSVVHTGKLRGRWLAEASLIGKEFYTILDSQKKAMQSGYVSIAHVAGKSGVGKSRILKEVLLQAAAFGMQTFIWDTDIQKGDFQTLIRNLISELESLPLPHGKSMVVQIDPEMSGNRALAAKLLYKDGELRRCSAQVLAEYLCCLMREKSVWIALDNVQNCDEKTLDILDHIITLSQGKTGQSGLLLAYNQDFLYEGTKADHLYQRLSAWSAQNPNQFQAHGLLGFNRIEALEYLRACLNHPQPDQRTSAQQDGDLFSMALEMLLDHCGTRPFYLQNILLYLEQIGILGRTEFSSFFIYDIAAFWDRIQELPPSVEAVIARRVNQFLENQPTMLQEECIRVFTLLTISESIPADICRDLFGAFQTRRMLLRAGFLSENADGSISLYHQYFEQYFRKIYHIQEASDALLRNFIAAIEKRRAVNKMLVPLFLSENVLGCVQKAHYQKLLQRLTAWQIDSRISSYLLPILADLIDRDMDVIPAGKYIEYYKAICFMTSNREGIERARMFYERLLSYFLENPWYFKNHAESLFFLLREHLINLNNLNYNYTGLKIADKIWQCLHLLELPEEQQYASSLEEIRCMLYYWSANTDQAISAAKKSADAALASGTPWMRLKSLREHGYACYYALDAAVRREEMCSLWDDGYRLYNTLAPDGPATMAPDSLQPYIATNLTSALADMARHDMPTARSKVLLLTNFIDKTGMPFYELKIRLLRAQFLLLEEYQNYGRVTQPEEIHRLIGQAADLCVSYYDLQDYPVCFYMQAVTYLLSGEHSAARDGFLKTYAVLERQINRHPDAYVIEDVWGYFYEDLAFYLREQGQRLPPDFYDKLHSHKIQNRVRQIMQCSDLDFMEQKEERVAITAITDFEGRWNFPKI